MPKQAALRLNEIELLTRRELALIFKIGVSTLDLIPDNELPRVHLGKSIRFTYQSVSNYIQKHETNKGNELSHLKKTFKGGKEKC